MTAKIALRTGIFLALAVLWGGCKRQAQQTSNRSALRSDSSAGSQRCAPGASTSLEASKPGCLGPFDLEEPLVQVYENRGGKTVEAPVPTNIRCLTAVHHGTAVEWNHPKEVFAKGFKRRGNNTNLYHHVYDDKNIKDTQSGDIIRTSAFRGTTVNVLTPDGEGGAALWAGPGGVVYRINCADALPTGRDAAVKFKEAIFGADVKFPFPAWDVNEVADALGGKFIAPSGATRNPLEEREIAIPGDVPAVFIEWVAVVRKMPSGKITMIRNSEIRNPGFGNAEFYTSDKQHELMLAIAEALEKAKFEQQVENGRKD